MENGTEWDNGQAIHKSCGQTMHAETHTCILFRWRAASTGERKRRRLRPYCMFPKGNRASSVQPGHRLWGCQIKGLEVVKVSSWAPQFVYTVDKLTRIFWESVCLLSRGSSWKTGMLVCCIRRGGQHQSRDYGKEDQTWITSCSAHPQSPFALDVMQSYLL